MREQTRIERNRKRARRWMSRVRAWAASFPQVEHVDDSRESIYGDEDRERGETENEHGT